MQNSRRIGERAWRDSNLRLRDRRFQAERKKEIPINKPPSQRFSRLRMSSEKVINSEV
jgi:hypothetical protein